MVTEKGCGHRGGMRAQRRGTGTETGCSCDAAVKQSCEKEGRYLVSQAKTREHFWPWGVREVLSDLRSSALGVPGRNSSGKPLLGARKALALPGKIPRSCQPQTEQAKPNSPSP